MSADLHIVTVEQTDPRLGRHVVHDPQSRRFAYPLAAASLPTKPVRHRVYGPRKTPSQRIGCCTCVDQVVKCDTAGNRRPGVVLDMADAERLYVRATQLDNIDGQYDPTTGDGDTGSTGLAACKAAAEAGLIERYEWLFAGARQVAAALAGGEGKPGKPVGVGTWWTENMFEPDPESLLVYPTGKRAGGHQWTVTGWDPRFQAFEGLCWWGDDFGDHGRFRIKPADLDALLSDDGDAHVTYRAA